MTCKQTQSSNPLSPNSYIQNNPTLLAQEAPHTTFFLQRQERVRILGSGTFLEPVRPYLTQTYPPSSSRFGMQLPSHLLLTLYLRYQSPPYFGLDIIIMLVSLNWREPVISSHLPWVPVDMHHFWLPSRTILVLVLALAFPSSSLAQHPLPPDYDHEKMGPRPACLLNSQCPGYRAQGNEAVAAQICHLFFSPPPISSTIPFTCLQGSV